MINDRQISLIERRSSGKNNSFGEKTLDYVYLRFGWYEKYVQCYID